MQVLRMSVKLLIYLKLNLLLLKVANIFLTKQGAIESCCAGFSMYCSTLFESSDKYLHGLPQALLELVSFVIHLLCY